MDNIQIKTGKTAQDFWKLASKKGFVRRGKVASKHSEMLAWLKSKEIGLGHVHANFIILYLRLRANDPELSTQSGQWARSSGYTDTRNKILVSNLDRRAPPLNENGIR
jgi:hypothetical protein